MNIHVHVHSYIQKSIYIKANSSLAMALKKINLQIGQKDITKKFQLIVMCLYTSRN